jgi:predicted O-methyltransferase YrrM
LLGQLASLPERGAEAVGRLGTFDLIFPDAPGGKIFKLRKPIAALNPGGTLIVDDMDLHLHDDDRSILVRCPSRNQQAQVSEHRRRN